MTKSVPPHFINGQLLYLSFGCKGRHKSPVKYIGKQEEKWGLECFEDCETKELYPFIREDGLFYLVSWRGVSASVRKDFYTVILPELL